MMSYADAKSRHLLRYYIYCHIYVKIMNVIDIYSGHFLCSMLTLGKTTRNNSYEIIFCHTLPK